MSAAAAARRTETPPPAADYYDGPPEGLPAHWERRARALVGWGAPGAGEMWQCAANELRHIAQRYDDEAITPAQAAREFPKVSANWIGKLLNSAVLTDRGGGTVRRGDVRSYLLTGGAPAERAPDISAAGLRPYEDEAARSRRRT